jgi:type II secretory pathway component GspD/PulD (secretin)
MKRIVGIAVLALCIAPISPAQQIREMEFKNQPIADILLALAEMAGRSIVPDETVAGNASYYFAETDFDTALRIFLSTYKMYFWREGSIYYVSKVRAQSGRDVGTATVDAEDVEVRLIVRALSRAIGKTVLFDALPRENLTVHLENMPPSRILEILLKRFPDYRIDSTGDYFYIRKTDAGARQDARTAGPPSLLTASGGMYALDADKARLRDILVELFQKGKVEYSLFLRSDTIVENLHFSGKKFEEMLRLVLEQASADFSVQNGIYYVYEIQRTDVLKKLKNIRLIPLTYISLQELPPLFPQEMASQNLYRLDKNTNTIILTGSDQEIGPLEEFIRKIDRPTGEKSYCRFDLSFLKVSDLPGVLPPSLSGIKPIALPQGNSFVMLLAPEGKKVLEEYLPLVDRRQPALPIQLKYIQADFLLKNLPPSVSREDLQQTGDSTLLFFTGSDDRRRQFLRELDLLDRPAPQIRYELLVVQYQEGQGLDWSLKARSSPLTGGSPAAFLGSIDKLLNLNFNIVSTFGYLFALELNLGLTANRANVLADTTLNGLSGQEIKFQNTETSRYQEVEIDVGTGKQIATGVTREITTGLIIGMNGWVSGDGMITMKVTSTVSKQGMSTSQQTALLPTTSEKVVSTNVRTPSGTPIVIGGLIEQNKDSTVQKVPVLGDIPLLGWLFQSRVETLASTELVIYIVPHVEHPESRASDAGRRMDDLYATFVKGHTGG